MRILRVDFWNINGHDDMNIVVDKYPESDIVYSATKPVDDGYLWVRIYRDGLADYGYTMLKDPMHNNQTYTWSSRSEVINEEFKLVGTPNELQLSNVGVKEIAKHPMGCYCSMGCTISLARDLVLANQDKMAHGVEDYFKYNFNENIVVVKPHKGLKLFKDRVWIKDKYLVKTSEGYCTLDDLAEYCLKHYGMWSYGNMPKEL